ncbi:glycoside hydrolase family 114 protein [Plenodomus tracheiphilus IPT5]|uniref:alpha-galactosidase n=1 Tax=Plenodomus tracheiphilus IPT5 TaxID=1408161 RepID=A0A6A7BD27_9PLEO|nr:glycoside hydrolase family 114 protein [Plenodomus tracheiphilus IPT5]
MSEKPTPRRLWSLRRKLLVGGIIALVLVALALGLGLGLTLGGNNGDDDDNSDTPPSSTLTPLPSPNTTFPWTPRVNDTWQIILSHPPVISDSDTTTTPNVDIFDIDLFETPTETIQRLHDLGKKVICYFSAGSYENWREDAGEFKSEDMGKTLNGWPGEKWLQVSSENVRRIMKERVELANSKGCDGVDPDNVDGYQNDNGLSLTQEDSISYMSYLSSITAPLNLTLGLKNAGNIIPVVLPLVQFSVNEQCIDHDECDTFQPFIAAGKPVFHIEYPDGAGDGESATRGLGQDTMRKFCSSNGDAEGSEGFSTVLKKMELDGWVEYCNGSVQTSALDESIGDHGQRR